MEVWTGWLIAAGFWIVLEMATTGFLVIWLGVGSLLAMAYSFFFPEQFLVQMIIFVVSSILLIVCTKKITDKFAPKTTATNVYSIIGKRAIVIEEINLDKSQGQIKVDGDVWSAKIEDYGTIIPKDSMVEVLRIEGVKAVVKLISEPVKQETVSNNNETTSAN